MTGNDGLVNNGADAQGNIDPVREQVDTPLGRVDADLDVGIAALERSQEIPLRIPTKSASCSDVMSAMHSDFKPAMIPI